MKEKDAKDLRGSGVVSELSALYADVKVDEKREYPACDRYRRKCLTRFDGFEIEQAYEDGANAVLDKILAFMADDDRISYDHIRKLINEMKGV